MKISKQHMKTRVEYCEEYDSFYNPIKDIWLEENCGDSNCIFCKNRPDKPSYNQHNVQEGVSNPDTLGTYANHPVEIPQDDSGKANVADNEDTGESTFPSDLNLYKCGHKTNGVIIMDDNILSMTAYIQWAEEEKNLETKKECLDCYLKRLDGK